MRRRVMLWSVVALGCVASLITAVTLITLHSGWFREQVRKWIIAETEHATGGRVEIGAFDYDWRTLTATISPFVVHGYERPDEPAFFRADKIRVGLKIVSLMKREVDLAALMVDRPQLYIRFDKDGYTNVLPPMPRWRNPANVAQDVVALRIQKFSLANGQLQYNEQSMPLSLQAEGVDVHAGYATGSEPRYTGDVKIRSMLLNSPGVSNADFALTSHVSLSHTRLVLTETRLGLGGSAIDLFGEASDFASPHGTLNLKADVRAADLVRPFHIPIEPLGGATFSGQAVFSSTQGLEWKIDGKAAAHELAFYNPSVNLSNVSIDSHLRLTSTGITLTDCTASGLGGSLHGRLDITDWRRLKINAEARSLSLASVARAALLKNVPWSGMLAGPVTVDTYFHPRGFRDSLVKAQLTVDPATGGTPIQGLVDAAYEQSANRITFGDSHLQFGATRAAFSGTLGQTLAIQASTSNLGDLPLPKDFPVKLNGGTARFDGTVAGPLDHPEISGHADATKFIWQGQEFDRATSRFDLTASRINAQTLSLTQGPFQLDGSGTLGLVNYQPSDASPLTATVTLKGADIQRIVKEHKWDFPITGILAATAQLTGTLGAPRGTAGIDAENVTAYGEQAQSIRASIILSAAGIQIINARIQASSGQIQGQAQYDHAANDWSTGQVRFELAGNNIALARIAHVQQVHQGIAGALGLTAKGTGRMTKGEFRVVTINSQVNVRNAAFEGRRYGDFNLTAVSHETTLAVHGSANLLGTSIQGSGEWKLEGDDPGHGQIVVPRVNLATLHEFLPNPSRAELPFEGFVEGTMDIDGPLRKPDQLTAQVRIAQLQLNASPLVKPGAGAAAKDLILHNARPITLFATSKGIEIKSADLAGTDTTIEAQGRLAFDPKAAWYLGLNGSINLAALQIFNPNLLASGNAVVNATIRGPLNEPAVEGRLQLTKASFFVNGLPNGLEQANGVILFDRSRATVDSLSATTGGGNINIIKGSFVGFRGPALLYRVQGSVEHVRYRSPEGVSLTVNALLNLIGSSDNSVLSGTITVVRAGFNPTADLANLLANTVKPVSTPAPSEYFKGMQLDLRVEGGQALEIQTALAHDLQAATNLSVRGTPDHPIVLGTISVDEGEIDFFGNKYHVNRGEITFNNPVRIDPTLDVDLETTVRGITVDIAFTGPLEKLNFSYRSDPPLQTSDILALLAVGRTPSLTGFTPTSASSNNTYLSTGSGTSDLLAAAISAPNQGRLQRFFGVSHIKIDPQLTDVTSVPQARLTVDQQISRDVTLSYITNLTRTQEQIIRVEWDLDRQWSVIALRDENGEFSLVFQYRKRFK